jgi:hypothetical protein
MRTFIIILITAVLAGIATWFLPWWMASVITFLMSVLLYLPPGKSFRVGAFSVMLLWLVVVLARDIPNEHILSTRMVKLFGLPHFSLYILVTLIIGGLVGGLAGWAGSLMNLAFRRK